MKAQQRTRDEVIMFMWEECDWTHYPLLPLVHRERGVVGVLMAGRVLTAEGLMITVIETNLFTPDWERPRIQFGSHAAVLDAGWEVD